MHSLKLLFFVTLVAAKNEFITTNDNICCHSEWSKSLKCAGKHSYNATSTAYYPSHLPNEDGFADMRGKKLRTLQDYIDGRAKYVTVSIDPALRLKYGSKLCIPELNHHYRRHIPFEVRDASDAVWRRGYSRIEICVRTEEDSYDLAVNRQVTLVFP